MAAGDLTSRHGSDYTGDLPYGQQYAEFLGDNHIQGQGFAQTFQQGMMVPKTMYGTAHDDSFLDGSNGVRYATAAGFSSASMANSANTRNKPNMGSHANNLYNPQNVFQYGSFPDGSMSYGDGGIFNQTNEGQMDKSSWTDLYGQFVPAVSQERVPGPRAMQHTQNEEGDDDNRSEAGSATTCDSHCGLSDPCTGEACANEVDACTDRNCPEKNCSEAAAPSKLPLDVVTAAATLAKIGVPGFQEHNYNSSQQALPTPELTDAQGSFSQGFNWQFPLDPSMVDISQHILWAHGDPNSSNCTRPCPVDNPMVFGHCHFPQPFNMDSSFSNPFGNINPFANGNSNVYGTMNNNMSHERITQMMKSENCGREISNPDEFVQHFNQEHRPALVNSMGQVHGDIGRRGPPNPMTRPLEQPSYHTSNMMMSPSLSSTPQTSSPHEPLPPTPQSLPQRPGTSSRLASTSHSRSSSTAKNGNGTHTCLWCIEESAEPCGLVFPDAEGLHNHVSQEHIKTMGKRGTDGFVCCWENCKRDEGGKKGFPQRSKIERHMQTHIGRKPFKCDECGNQFSARQALDQHKLIHTNEKPLKCDWPGCDQTFRQQSALTMHKRTHTKEKPLICPHCGKAFSESSNLSKHKRIHEGKGKFTCDWPRCEKSFHRKDQLRRHVLLHEPKESAAGDRRMSMLSSVSSEGATGLEDESVMAGEVRSADDSFDSEFRDAKRLKLEGNVFA